MAAGRGGVEVPAPRGVVARAAALVAAVLFPWTAHSSVPDPARLSLAVTPTAESIHLDLDAGRKGYSGRVTIDLRVHAATDSFRLHARELALGRVIVRQGRGVFPATATAGEVGLVTLRTARPLRAGRATLEIDFTADFSTRAASLSRVEADGRWYAFTDFEPDDARGAWPCWDEPSFKIPWRVSVTVPKDHRAIANTLPEKETVQGARRTVVFRRTRPLPSYLVALMTGPFDMVPIPGLQVPGRVVAVRGNGRLATPAAQETAPIVAALERYFGRRYPYPKLDLIAVPEFSSGAMENAGAITFRANRLLLDPGSVSPAQRKGLISITAHELAHMWFGDLVTLAWWDDLWLNESFASWLGDKITAEVAPEFGVGVDEVSDALRAMATDSRLTTRAIRAEIRASDNLSGLFDVLSYQKGQAVLNMLERWLTPETFRAGVTAYLEAHEDGNATASDLWAALSKVAGRDVGSVATSFLDQPGVPLVTLEPLGGNRVRLTQRRFLNYGLTEPKRARWRIPITLRASQGGRTVAQHVLLADSAQVVQLPGEGAPDWIYPNADERGYYRWAVPDAMLATLADRAPQALDARERVGFLGNLRALLDAGQVHGERYLEVLERFAHDPDPQVVAVVVNALAGLRHPFVTDQTRPEFAAYVRRALSPALERIGWQPAPGEPRPVTLLRPQLLLWLGDDGRDPRVLEWGTTSAEAYLRDPAAVDPSLQDVAITLAALRGDAHLFEVYRARFESADVPTERARFLTGLGSFRDPELVERALRYSVEGPLRPQEIMAIANEAGAHPELKDRVFEWTLAHFADIASRIPPSGVPNLPRQADGCSLERAARAREFFTRPEYSRVGTLKELEKMEASVRDCVSLREREGVAVERHLRRLAQVK